MATLDPAPAAPDDTAVLAPAPVEAAASAGQSFAGVTSREPRTADDVLDANEIRRSRVWVWLTTTLAVAGLASAAWLPAATTGARLVLAGGCGVLLVASLIASWVLADDARYNRKLAALFASICVACAAPAYYFFGWFSGVVLLVPVGAIMFSMGQTTGAVIAMAIGTIGTHAAVALLTIRGTIPDHSLATIRDTQVQYQLVYMVMCEAMFTVSYAVGRLLRHQTHADVARYGVAVRETARREALLNEALDELARVRRAGEPGRYTGLTLGEFHLGVVLGRGAMGEVYEADDASGRTAAVKVMSSAGATSEQAVSRFEREIEVAKAVESPHIVRVLDYCATSDPVMYLAMERLRGRNLAELLRSDRRLSVGETLEMLAQIASGIDAVHRAGVVHRDLKPGNVFRHDANGANDAASTHVWKVLDFGVSKLLGGSGTLTGGGLVGTPNYMSPEQASGRDIDRRSDVFALGCIAYRCLTGRPPFSGREVVDVLYAIVHRMPPRPALIAPLPLEVDLVLAIALAKDPEHRFSTCKALADALADAARAQISDGLERRGDALLALQPWDE